MDGYSLCQVDLKLAAQLTPCRLDTQTHHIAVVLQFCGERYPGGLESRNTIKSYHTTNLTQEIDWERHKRVAASGQG